MSESTALTENQIAERIAKSRTKGAKKLRPNPKYSIAALEARGYTVRVYHHRRKLILSDVVPASLHSTLKQGFINLGSIPVCITQEGGETTVEIGKDGQYICMGFSKCHPKEPYWKKLGVSICIEDAAKRHPELEAALSAEPGALADSTDSTNSTVSAA